MAPAAVVVHTFPVATDRRLRIDVYLRECVPWRSRTQLRELIDAGGVRINGQPCKASHRIRRGDTVAVALPSEPQPALAFAPGQIQTLYVDEDLAVLNKPSGILTHPIVGHQNDTLVNYVRATFPDRGEPHTCHRLDRETSGTILVAFTLGVCQLIQKQFEGRQVSKSYLALVRGRFPEAESRIDIPIGPGKDLASALASARARRSLTMASLVAAGETASLVRAVPITGRQNQIRIHLAAAGFPLIGDPRFGDSTPPPPTTDHFLLHAERLRFYHPAKKLPAEIAAPPPGDFLATLAYLKLSVDR